MKKLIRNVMPAFVAGLAGAWLAIATWPVTGEAQGYRPPRLADGHPDFNGIWQVMNEANYDVQMHAARPALALRDGPYGLVPDAPVLALGAVGAVPPGAGVVEGDELPYRPDALTTKRENQQKWLSRDPEIKCYLPGVPRATYMPYPFQIVQSASQLMMVYEYAGAVRDIHLKDPGPAPVDSWMGQSVARWDGDTLIVDVTGQNDQTWFDRSGNFHSEALHVVERYTRTSADVMSYEATIEDPNVFMRPWKMSMPLYRRQERNAQLMDFKCVEFVEELMYGRWRKRPLDRLRPRPWSLGLSSWSVLEFEVPGRRTMDQGRTNDQGRTGHEGPGTKDTSVSEDSHMRHRWLVVTMMAGMLLALSAVQPAPVEGQGAKPYSPKRLADGRPDLQGTYDLATLTPLERPAGMKGVLTREEVAKLERAVATQVDEGAKPISGDRAAPPKGGDGSAGAAGNVGGYNTFWLDPGSTFTVVNGEIRTSIIVDPPDGRIPAMTPAARQRIAARLLAGAGLPNNDRGLETAPGAYDDPERRPLGERCLLGFGSTAGPPALPNYFYNNLHKIVQTPNTVLILNEMVHDVRVVRMNASHPPKHIRKWMGDSVGRWEGNTLVVDTTNFNADQIRYAVQAAPGRGLFMVESLGAKSQDRLQGPSQELHVIERFTRVADNALLYRFTVEDPGTWVAPFTGEFTWPATGEQIFEYACHEANYAMENILRGARQRDAAK